MPRLVCLAGTWDPEFARNKALTRILRIAGCDVSLCQVPLWGVRGDTIVKQRKLAVFAKAAWAYPLLLWKFLRTPRPDVVIVPYPGHFDMLLLGPLCRLRRIPVVFDIFISLFDTIVTDRRLRGPNSPVALVALAADRLACRAADLIFADTPAHAAYFSGLSKVPPERFRVLWLGAQESIFHPRSDIVPDPDLVLFHGTFVPLQGLETIVRAAKLLETDGIRIRILGDGQDRETVERLVDELRIENLERVGLVPLDRVPKEIAGAGICLGIFGTGAKADRVIPNKLYECLAVGRPVITGGTTAVRTGFTEDEVTMVPVGDAAKLAAAIRRLRRDPELRERLGAAGHARFKQTYSEEALSKLLAAHLDLVLAAR